MESNRRLSRRRRSQQELLPCLRKNPLRIEFLVLRFDSYLSIEECCCDVVVDFRVGIRMMEINREKREEMAVRKRSLIHHSPRWSHGHFAMD
jgi:hypothetical protein